MRMSWIGSIDIFSEVDLYFSCKKYLFQDSFHVTGARHLPSYIRYKPIAHADEVDL